MKIGADIRVLMDEYYSGVSQYTANLLNAIFLLDDKNEYKLYYNSWSSIDERLGKWKRSNSVIIGTHYPNKIYNYFFQKIFKRPKIDRCLKGCDVFWSPHFNFSSFSDQAKTIITVHDLSFLRYPEFFSLRKNIWHRALGIKKILKNADKIIAVSQNTKNDVIELMGIAADKVQVIYSGNNAELSLPDSAAVQNFLVKNNISGRYILYLGTIEPRKNISGLIRAYNLLRENNPSCSDVKLVLAGAKGWKNKGIYRLWEKSPFRNDIKFLGYVSEIEREILYSAASLFVYPSFYEGFGFPPLEAMAHGVPVVCSNISSLPEVVGKAGLMVDPYRIEEIFEAMSAILSNPSLRANLVSASLERVKLFSWEKTAREYLAIFKEYEKK